MKNFLFVWVIVTALVFVVHCEEEEETEVETVTEANDDGAVETVTEANTGITVSSGSVKIVVKCRDTNSLLTNIYLDNSGTAKMNNIQETNGASTESPISIVFDTCRARSNNFPSLFNSFGFGSGLSSSNFPSKLFGSSFFNSFGDKTNNGQKK